MIPDIEPTSTDNSWIAKLLTLSLSIFLFLYVFEHNHFCPQNTFAGKTLEAPSHKTAEKSIIHNQATKNESVGGGAMPENSQVLSSCSGSRIIEQNKNKNVKTICAVLICVIEFGDCSSYFSMLFLIYSTFFAVFWCLYQLVWCILPHLMWTNDVLIHSWKFPPCMQPKWQQHLTYPVQTMNSSTVCHGMIINVLNNGMLDCFFIKK